MSRNILYDDVISIIYDYANYWSVLSTNINSVDIKFVEKYHNKFDWYYISCNSLDNNFIIKFQHKIHWNAYIRNNYKNIDEKLIEKIKKTTDWELILKYCQVVKFKQIKHFFLNLKHVKEINK